MANRLTGRPSQPSRPTVAAAEISGTARMRLPRRAPKMRHSTSQARAKEASLSQAAWLRVWRKSSFSRARLSTSRAQVPLWLQGSAESAVCTAAASFRPCTRTRAASWPWMLPR